MNNNDQKHTPTPWAVKVQDKGTPLILASGKKTKTSQRTVSVVASDGSKIADFRQHSFGALLAKYPSEQANAEFAVRAVNSHDELLALARDFLTLMEDSETRKFVDATRHGTFDYYAKNARAVLAKAEGSK